MFQDYIGQNSHHRHPQDFVSNFRRPDSWTLCIILIFLSLMFQGYIGHNCLHSHHPQDFVSNFHRPNIWTLRRHAPRVASSRLQGEGSWSEAEAAGEAELQGQDGDENRSG